MTHDDTLKRAAELLRESAHELQLSHSAPSSNYAFDSIVEPEVRADTLEHRNLAAALDALREELARQEPVAHMFPSDLERFETSETSAQAYSVAVGNPDECSVQLYTSPQPAQVPEGWRLVPIEPTGEMIAAGCQPGEVIDNADMACAYKAMLAAAPQPKEKS